MVLADVPLFSLRQTKASNSMRQRNIAKKSILLADVLLIILGQTQARKFFEYCEKKLCKFSIGIFRVPRSEAEAKQMIGEEWRLVSQCLLNSRRENQI